MEALGQQYFNHSLSTTLNYLFALKKALRILKGSNKLSSGHMKKVLVIPNSKYCEGEKFKDFPLKLTLKW